METSRRTPTTPRIGLETTLNAESILTSFKYDLAGNRTQVTDGKNQVTKFAYDGLNRLTRTTDAAGASEQLFYNAENKTTRIDSMGRGTTYVHDTRHQLKSVFYQGAPEDTLEYEYDENGNLLSVDQAGTERDVVYEYDDRNRVTDETSNGVVHEYAYDLAGNRTGITYGGTGRELEMVYDDLNRVTSIEDGDKLTEFTYTRTGSEASRTYKATGSTVTSKQASTFDGLGRLDTRTGYGGSNPIYTYDYDYDVNGNVSDIVETYTSGQSDRTLEMEYDDADRLELENITEGGVLTSTEYEYDAANNRTIRAVTVGSNPTVTGTYAYNALNQLTGVTFSDTTPAISFSYDAQGNRTSREQDSMLSSYAYDRENRLTAVQLGGEFKTINIHPVMGSTLGAPTVATYRLGGGGTLHTYGYDYRTRRVKRTEAGETTNVVFSGGTAILEMTGTDATPSAPTVEFVRGDGMGGGVGGMLYSERSGTTSVSHHNNRGDIVAKVTGTDANPYTVTYQAAYEAFGTRKAEDGSTADRQKANTKDEDPTGLLNEGFRFRDLETGTFLTRDPAGFVDGPNLYAYVVQNPWTKFDPEGLLDRNQDQVNASSQMIYKERRRLAALFGEKGQLQKKYSEEGVVWKRKEIFGEIQRKSSEIGESADRIASYAQDVHDFYKFDTDGNGEVDDGEYDHYQHSINSTEVPLDPIGIGIAASLSKGMAVNLLKPRTFTSSDPLVANLANKIESMYPGHVVGVNVPIRNATGKLLTDADILLENSVVQVKSGRSAQGLLRQLQSSEAATGLPSVGFGPNLPGNSLRILSRQGGLVTGDESMLLEVVKP